MTNVAKDGTYSSIIVVRIILHESLKVFYNKVKIFIPSNLMFSPENRLFLGLLFTQKKSLGET